MPYMHNSSSSLDGGPGPSRMFTYSILMYDTAIARKCLRLPIPDTNVHLSY